MYIEKHILYTNIYILYKLCIGIYIIHNISIIYTYTYIYINYVYVYILSIIYLLYRIFRLTRLPKISHLFRTIE